MTRSFYAQCSRSASALNGFTDRFAFPTGRPQILDLIIWSLDLGYRPSISPCGFSVNCKKSLLCPNAFPIKCIAVVVTSPRILTFLLQPLIFGTDMDAIKILIYLKI